MCPCSIHYSLGLILKAQHVPRYKFGHGHTKRQRSVQRLFPSSVSGQLSGFQMGTALCTELGKCEGWG